MYIYGAGGRRGRTARADGAGGRRGRAAENTIFLPAGFVSYLGPINCILTRSWG